MKLNVGCGDHYAWGWVNLDLSQIPGQVTPDLIGSLTDLPVDVQGMTHVYLGHVLEHLDIDDVIPALKQLWQRCEPGAKVAIIGPDVHQAEKMFRQKKITALELSQIRHGGHRWEGDAHLWECDSVRLFSLAADSGLMCRPVPIWAADLDEFPVASLARWHCAVVGNVMKGKE
jgi:hypothetical protein